MPFILVLLLLIRATDLAAQVELTPRDSAFHALNRLAYGPRPGETDRVAKEGVMRWIERQLESAQVNDPALGDLHREFPILDDNRKDLARRLEMARQERKALKADGDSTEERLPPSPDDPRRLAGQLQQLAVVRAAAAEHQLQEVMADFWTNHFNVVLSKGADRYLLPSYIEETIRPNALGRFEDLLIATAKNPAMLFYLDNVRSVAAGSEPPSRARDRLDRQRRRRDQRGPDSAGRRVGAEPATGINENYARELLELHTLGVDGGYTQQDVIAVARILTGWGIRAPGQGSDFEFHDWAHDRGEKTVLGETFPSGHGKDEGERLLKMLANHPATMHHLSAKLCARFVSDDPPDGCVDDAVRAWKESGGEIRAVLRAIFHSPDFWAASAVRSKIKTPFEFVISALRATGARPDSSPGLAQSIARLGQPLYLQPSPAGYPERQEDWVNSGALLNRMNLAVALAANRVAGARVDLDQITLPMDDADALLTAINAEVLGGTMSERTRDVIRKEVTEIRDPMEARALAVGLAIGGPEFQRQ